MGEVIPLPYDNEAYWGEQLEIAERKVAYASRMLAAIVTVEETE